MDPASEPDVGPESKNVQTDLRSDGTESERITARVHYLFRQVGDNLAARELEQRLMVYRLSKVSA